MEDKFELLIQQMLTQGYGVIDDFISESLLLELQQNLNARYVSGLMKSAGIGNQNQLQNNQEIRNDFISWLEDDSINPSEHLFLSQIKEFVSFLNLSCYAGIRSHEFHFALYKKGSFYKKHLDQFKKNGSRLYSVILYLNDNWLTTDGGELLIYLANETTRIEPKGGRLVFFKSSDIEHEVLPSTRDRISLTGWFKNNI